MSGERRDDTCAICRFTVATGFRDPQAFLSTVMPLGVRVWEAWKHLAEEAFSCIGITGGAQHEIQRGPRRVDGPVGDDEVSKAAGDILFSWAFKAGRHAVGWSILARSLSALATLALWQDDPAPAERLKAELAKRLNTENAPEQEMRDDAARELRERAATLYKSGFRLSRIHSAMAEIDQEKMQALLQDIADLLSPGTAGEPLNLGVWP